VWQVGPGQRILEVAHAHDKVIRCLAFSPDSHYLVSASSDQSAKVWDLDGRSAPVNLPHDGAVYWVAFSPDGSEVATASGDGSARVWNLGDPASRPLVLAHPKSVDYVAYHPRGALLLTACEDGLVRLWRCDDDKPVTQTSTALRAGPDARPQFDLAGERILLVCRDATVAQLRLCSGLSQASGGLAEATENAFVLDTADRTSQLDFARFANLRADEVSALDVSPDRRRLAAGTQDKKARILDTEDGRTLFELPHDDTVNSVRFSPDGLRLATSTSSGQVCVWDTRTGLALLEAPIGDPAITHVRFSQDGSHVVTSVGHALAVSQIEGPVPDWLPAVAEAIGRSRLNEANAPEPVRAEAFIEIRGRVLAMTNDTPMLRWAKRLLE